MGEAKIFKILTKPIYYALLSALISWIQGIIKNHNLNYLVYIFKIIYSKLAIYIGIQ